MDKDELVSELIGFADTMRGVSRYYMTARTTYEREQLIRRAAARLAGYESALRARSPEGGTDV
jgi:hypothetical protein